MNGAKVTPWLAGAAIVLSIATGAFAQLSKSDVTAAEVQSLKIEVERLRAEMTSGRQIYADIATLRVQIASIAERQVDSRDDLRREIARVDARFELFAAALQRVMARDERERTPGGPR